MTQGPLICSKSARRLARCTQSHNESTMEVQLNTEVNWVRSHSHHQMEMAQVEVQENANANACSQMDDVVLFTNSVSTSKAFDKHDQTLSLEYWSVDGWSVDHRHSNVSRGWVVFPV